MKCGIYKITNLIDGKVYVGSSINLDSREYKHFWMLKRGSHDNVHLQHSFNLYKEKNFIFNIIEECDEKFLIEKENFYINKHKSNQQKFGYNLATVNEFRRNNLNDSVKMKISKFYLNKNGNFKKYSLTNTITNEEQFFDNLIDGAKYLINNGFAKGKERNVRMSISNCLRGILLNNGGNGCIRKSCYKHKFKIIE